MKKMKRMSSGGTAKSSTSKSTTTRGPGGSMAAAKASASRSGVGNSRGSSSGTGAKPAAGGAGSRFVGGAGGVNRFASKGPSVAASANKRAAAPAARPVRPLGGTNPMASQGTSFKSPYKAQKANESYIKKQGFGNRVMKNAEMEKIAARKDILDQRRVTGPFDPRDPKYSDEFGRFNPNNPLRRADVRKSIRDSKDAYEGDFRKIVIGNNKPAGLTPQEIRDRTRAAIERSDKVFGEEVNRIMSQQKGAMTPIRDDYKRFRTEVGLPDVPVRPERGIISTLADSYKNIRKSYGDALYGPSEEDSSDFYRKGGLVKKPKKKNAKKD